MDTLKKHKSVIFFVVLIGFFTLSNLFARAAEEPGMLFEKVTRNDTTAVKDLITSGADIDQQNEMYGHTPLIVACNLNYVELAKLLISMGADINLRGKDGSSALIAAGANSQELVELLLSKGADINARMVDGTGVFTQCIRGIFWDAVSIELAELLLSKGVDVNEAPTSGDATGFTNLIMAANNNNEELVRFLIKNGADVNARTSSGATALSHAVKNEYQNIIDILKSNGAK
ncbi:MAG: ankyrin repeat domain-containing protein [Candidatus Krumholzibacteria bacterium]|nr:ankyrin repeat domain-containing protein [Candidatus Krumholzibacteria bacterium]